MSRKRLLIVVAGAADGVLHDDALVGAFLRDTVAAASHPETRADVWLVMMGGSVMVDLPSTVRLIENGNPDGAGTVALFEQGFASGYLTVCLINSATPHLPPAFVQEAFGRMEASAVTGAGVDAVWVPTDQGECCLVGARRLLPDLLTTQSGAGFPLVSEMMQRAQGMGLAYHELPCWYAVRTEDETAKLRRDIKRGVAYAPETAKFFMLLPL